MKCSGYDALKFFLRRNVKIKKPDVCDILCRQKSISVTFDKLSATFADGIVIDSSAVYHRIIKDSDIYPLFKPSTMFSLPNEMRHRRVARFFCEVKYPLPM